MKSMRILGRIFLVGFAVIFILGIGMAVSFGRGNVGPSFELIYDMPMNTYEFNWSVAFIFWIPGLSLILAALVLFWMDKVSGNLDRMQETLKEIASNTRTPNNDSK